MPSCATATLDHGPGWSAHASTRDASSASQWSQHHHPHSVAAAAATAPLRSIQGPRAAPSASQRHQPFPRLINHHPLLAGSLISLRRLLRGRSLVCLPLHGLLRHGLVPRHGGAGGAKTSGQGLWVSTAHATRASSGGGSAGGGVSGASVGLISTTTRRACTRRHYESGGSADQRWLNTTLARPDGDSRVHLSRCASDSPAPVYCCPARPDDDEAPDTGFTSPMDSCDDK